MKYDDERIVALRRKAWKEQYNSIETGIYVKEELYKFNEVLLFGDTLSVKLPEGFYLADAQIVRYKYPSEFRPQVIMSNDSGKVNFTFSEFEQSAQWELLPEMLRELRTAIMNLHPSVLLLHFETQMAGENAIPWMDFKSFSMDGSLYNFVFLFLKNDNPVLGMFNCPYSEREDWSYLFKKCLETLSVIER